MSATPPRRPAGAPLLLAFVLGVAVLPAARGGVAEAAAQEPSSPVDSARPTVRLAPGQEYTAGPMGRYFNGDNHRELWLRPLEVRVLDLDRYGGGLEPDHEGGNQTRTLHFNAPDGRTYIFRSVRKYLDRVLPPDLRDTWFHDLAQDHMSAFHPTGGLVVPALHAPLGLLAVPADLRVMPADPRLGEFGETFAGTLGLVVERPNEGEDNQPLYGGYSRIISTERLLERLEEHPRNQVDARQYLASRLLDFVVGDTDRGPDQWRWGQEEEPWGFRWRPIAQDRDWAFVRADGALAGLARTVFPKLVSFDRRIPGIDALTFADQGLGRRLLVGLAREQWREVVDEVYAGLSDDVIDAAVALLPPEHRRDHAGALAAALKARREQLPAVADAFYDHLSEAVDVRGTDRNDRAEIVRHPDGTLRVALLAPARDLVPEEEDEEAVAEAVAEAEAEGVARQEPTADEPAEEEPDDLADGAARAAPRDSAAAVVEDSAAAGAAEDPRARPEPEGWAPYYERTFRPDETREVRVFLHGGDDAAVVRGTGAQEITVRVLGGGGDDTLHDAGTPSRRTVLYDDRGSNTLVPGGRTRVDTRSYEPPPPPSSFFGEELTRRRDFGRSHTRFSPAVDYQEGAGLVVGGGPTWTSYGFRRHPYASRVSLRGLVGTTSGELGAEVVAERWLENSSLGVQLRARATQLEAVRFYGLGNDAPALDPEPALIRQDRAAIEPSLVLRTERWRGEIGPVFRWVDSDVPAGNPADYPGAELPGLSGMTELGARAEARFRHTDHDRVPTRGVQLSATVAGYPVAGDDATRVGADAEARGYLPLPLPTGSVLALRAGGRRVWGDAPVHDLATVGGRTTIRGYRWQRFSGDAAAWGGAELRVPMMRVNLGLARGRLGVLGLADAGRVWVDGASPGEWHTGYGAGLFFLTLDTAVHVVWAQGDGDRVYLGMGLPF